MGIETELGSSGSKREIILQCMEGIWSLEFGVWSLESLSLALC